MPEPVGAAHGGLDQPGAGPVVELAVGDAGGVARGGAAVAEVARAAGDTSSVNSRPCSSARLGGRLPRPRRPGSCSCSSGARDSSDGHSAERNPWGMCRAGPRWSRTTAVELQRRHSR